MLALFVTICELSQVKYEGTLFKAITDARAAPKETPDRSPFSLVAQNGKYLKYFNDPGLSSNIEVPAGIQNPKPRG